MRRVLLALLVIVANFSLAHAQVDIIPTPQLVNIQPGQLSFDVAKGISWPKASKAATVMSPLFKQLFGLTDQPTGQPLRLLTVSALKDVTSGDKAAYRLDVDKKGITIQATDHVGHLAGLQSLMQLMTVEGTQATIPFVSIQDAPRFQWRGMHLDVSRHFFPIDFLKKYVELLMVNKLNTFHLHLTDDQGWRMEIKQYPKLTTIGSQRKETRKFLGGCKLEDYDGTPHGGFYTQAELKDLVAYAADRGVTIVPEIDMPGHMQAAIAAYPEWGAYGPAEVWTTWGVSKHILNIEPETIQAMKNILDEVMAVFPSAYIHIGGDEAEKTAWKQNSKVQARMKAMQIADEHKLQSWFITEMEKHINSKGRKLIGWDEILEGGLAPNAAVMSWRGVSGGIEAAKSKHVAVMTPGKPLYFDHYQSDRKWEEPLAIGGNNSLENVLAYDPAPDTLGKAVTDYIIGVQANVWTEYMASTKHVEYMVIPRIFALSEIAWSKPGQKAAFPIFKQRAAKAISKMMKLGYTVRPLDK